MRQYVRYSDRGAGGWWEKPAHRQWLSLEFVKNEECQEFRQYYTATMFPPPRTSTERMTTLAIVAVAILVLTPVDSEAVDPRNESECLIALAGALESECRRIYEGAGQESTREQCLGAIAPQLESVCEKFFGEGADFCATCNNSCTDSFPSGSERRKECLSMCLNHPGC